ncbi:hypothetical protein RRG08_034308 [Elysia crispata]|uniref:Uncharacterized protein n=1 Tax=Elysia crispata TaxID=231223 RepID=A0AAE1DZ28_9GAST|nr:hypothetical protein RRG08_034308 [Elysia crispata]
MLAYRLCINFFVGMQSAQLTAPGWENPDLDLRMELGTTRKPRGMAAFSHSQRKCGLGFDLLIHTSDDLQHASKHLGRRIRVRS